MSQVIDIDQSLAKWKTTTAKMLRAIEIRDYRLYKRCFSEGGRHFKQLRAFLDINSVNTPELKEQIQATVDAWCETVPKIKVWQSEIGDELSNVKTKLRKKKKIRRGYAQHVRTTGLNVSRKAK